MERRFLVKTSVAVMFMAMAALTGTTAVDVATAAETRETGFRSLFLAGTARQGPAQRRARVGAQAVRFRKGRFVRYIDFDAGDDAKDGKTQQTAWKHHPWDANATGEAKACKGIQTYVFKGGVVYRGALKAAESGAPGNPIRLTSDPAWGKGEAIFYGSTQIKGGWKKANAEEAPGIPQPEKVWYIDLGKNYDSGSGPRASSPPCGRSAARRSSA